MCIWICYLIMIVSNLPVSDWNLLAAWRQLGHDSRVTGTSDKWKQRPLNEALCRGFCGYASHCQIVNAFTWPRLYEDKRFISI